MSAPAPAPARVPPPGPVDPAERGTLTVAPAVLRAIVERAADAVAGTLPVQRSLRSSGISARVTAGGADAVDVRLEVALAYPGTVRDVVAAVRRRVAADLDRMAGRRLRRLTVTVAGLRAAPEPATRPR